jgi:hypothetical protein
MRKKKEKTNSKITVLKKADLHVHYSDGMCFSKPEKYRGYYISYAEFDQKTGDMGLSVLQRILPHISEQTDKNDKAALAVFDDFAHNIELIFDKPLVRTQPDVQPKQPKPIG